MFNCYYNDYADFKRYGKLNVPHFLSTKAKTFTLLDLKNDVHVEIISDIRNTNDDIVCATSFVASQWVEQHIDWDALSFMWILQCDKHHITTGKYNEFKHPVSKGEIIRLNISKTHSLIAEKTTTQQLVALCFDAYRKSHLLDYNTVKPFFRSLTTNLRLRG
jgi:hypothetical protein